MTDRQVNGSFFICEKCRAILDVELIADARIPDVVYAVKKCKCKYDEKKYTAVSVSITSEDRAEPQVEILITRFDDDKIPCVEDLKEKEDDPKTLTDVTYLEERFLKKESNRVAFIFKGHIEEI